MNRRLSILSLLALSLGVYVATAAQPALLDDADASHALVSREMLQRGDWVVMYQDGIRYLEKAPLHYWMVAVSYKLFGQGAFRRQWAARRERLRERDEQLLQLVILRDLGRECGGG